MSTSRIGLGLAALGRPAYINLGHAEDLGGDRSVRALERHCHRVLLAAWRGGVRHFDVARSYGRGEHFLGTWLKVVDPRGAQAFVSSKWGYTYTAGWRVFVDVHEEKDHGLAALERQWPESWERLGRWLKLYQIHSVTPKSPVLADRAVLDRLRQLRANGVRIGLSVSGPRQGRCIDEALAVHAEEPVFDSVQATWNLLETSAGPALARAHAAGLQVIVKEGLANGRLTRRNMEGGFTNTAELLAREAERLSTGMDAVSLAAVLAQPWADVVLSGAATVDQLHENLAAEQLAIDRRTLVRFAALSEPAEAYWTRRARLRWT